MMPILGNLHCKINENKIPTPEINIKYQHTHTHIQHLFRLCFIAKQGEVTAGLQPVINIFYINNTNHNIRFRITRSRSNYGIGRKL